MRRMRTFPAIPQSVHAARRFATDAVLDGAGEDREAVELMVSELATNCIRHERASFHVAITRSEDELRVEVTDSGTGTPQMRSPSPDEPSGRGLQIVNMLSQAWGVTPEDPTGKTVWFTVALQGSAHDDPAARRFGTHYGDAPSTVAGGQPIVQPAHDRCGGPAARGSGGVARDRRACGVCSPARAAQACPEARRYSGHEPGCHARRPRRLSDLVRHR